MVQSTLTPELTEIALEALNAYMHALPVAGDRPAVEIEAELDRKRVEVIEKVLKPLVSDYLGQKISAVDFKRQVDGTNKQHPLWGFGGIKGQMFFNLLLKTAEDASECDKQLRSAIREPANEGDASTQLRNFKNYVTRVAKRFVDAGGDARGAPKSGSIPFFVSYFWQIQRRDVWPVYYTNSVQMIEGMNFLAPTGEIADDYLAYKHLHETLIKVFSEADRMPFSLYDVEHVFWFKSGKMLAGNSVTEPATKLTRPIVEIETSKEVLSSQTAFTQPHQTSVLPDSGDVPMNVEIGGAALLTLSL